MVRMVIAVLIVLLAVLVAAGVWISRRRGADETHSVEGYQHTLSTLQTIRSRSNSPSVRVIDPGESLPPGAAGPGIVGIRGPGAAGVGPAGKGGLRHAGAAGSPLPVQAGADTPPGGLVFDDVATGTVPGARRGGAGNHRQERAISVMNHRPRHLGGPIVAALVVIALIAVLLVIGGRTKHGSGTTGTTGTGASATSASTARQGGGTATSTRPARRPARSGRKSGAARRTASPTTPTQYVAVASSASSATYTPPGASYTLGVSATSGNCWVQVKEVATGTTPLAQTLTPGQQQSLSAQGEVTILLGAPSQAAVTLNGVPVVLPSGARAPLTLTFAPSAAPSPSGPTTTPTT